MVLKLIRGSCVSPIDPGLSFIPDNLFEFWIEFTCLAVSALGPCSWGKKRPVRFPRHFFAVTNRPTFIRTNDEKRTTKTMPHSTEAESPNQGTCGHSRPENQALAFLPACVSHQSLSWSFPGRVCSCCDCCPGIGDVKEREIIGLLLRSTCTICSLSQISVIV
jgi:hypothetical protein